MKCTKCGFDNFDNSKFCCNCGEELKSQEQTTLTETAAPSNSERKDTNESLKNNNGNEESGNTLFCSCGATIHNSDIFCCVCGKPVEGRIKKRNTKPILAVVIILLLFTCGLIVKMIVDENMGEIIDLSKYVDVSFAGSDGNGTAQVQFDTDSFVDDWSGKIKYRKNSTLDRNTDAAYYITSKYYDSVIELDKNSGLHIGEKIRLYVNNDVKNEIERDLKCHLIFQARESETSGLAESIDIYSNIELDYTGVEKHCKIAITGGTYLDNSYDFRIFKGDQEIGSTTDFLDLSAGDKITIEVCDFDSIAERLKDKGVPKSKRSNTYTVPVLEKPETFDAKDYFEKYVKIDMSNKINLIGRLDIECTTGKFDIENNGLLKNGDTVSIKFVPNADNFDEIKNSEFEYKIKDGFFEKRDFKDYFEKNVKADESSNINKMGRLSLPNDAGVQYRLDNNDNLENGQKVKVTYFKGENDLGGFDYTIPKDMFQKADTIDLFENAKFDFELSDSLTKATAKLSDNSDEFDYFMIKSTGEEVDTNDEFVNGDNVTVYVQLSWKSYEELYPDAEDNPYSDGSRITDEKQVQADLIDYCYKKKSKKIPDTYKKTFICETEYSYVEKKSDINEDGWKKIESGMKESVSEYYPYSNISYNDIRHLLYVNKENGNYKNCVVIVANITATDQDDGTKETAWVYYTCMNLIHKSTTIMMNESEVNLETTHFSIYDEVKYQIYKDLLGYELKEVS